MCVSALTQRQFLKSFLIGLLLIASILQSTAQIRLTKVDVANDKVIIKNFGGSAVDISGYWFCHSFTYHQVSDGTIVSGSSNLAAGAQVELTLAQSLNNAGSDLSFYTSPSFGSSGAMVDFTQWGSGGNGRENVAVAKGIWTAGQFVNATSTTIYYGGSGSENGLAQWSTIPHPSVTSIVRQTPTDATTDADQVVFRVTFDRGVQNVDVSDFSISGTAAGDGTVNSVSAVSNSVYDVTITGVTNSAGTINLDINGNGSTAGINTIIADPLILDQNQPNGGNTINRSEFGQSFTANNTGVVSSVTLNVSGASTYTGAATMELRSGDGLSGGVLATETINITSGSGEKNFTFTTPGNVTSGSQYTIRFTGPGTFSSEFVVTATQGDPLSGGVIYQPTALASADLTVKIFVTSGGQGGLTSTAPGTDETYTIQNNLAPTATNVTFTGTLEVGQQLSGTYTWADADNGDTESGTTFIWYRSDDASGTNKTAIPSATAQTYTLTNDDKLKFISFEVTPNDGITAGTPVESVRQLVATIFINSIVRQSPTDATTGDDEVTFRVTFSDDVRFVSTDDFLLSGTAAGDGTISSVTAVSSSIYDVKVTGITNSTGTINLDLKGVDASGSNDIAKIPTQLDASSTADVQITDSPVFGQSFQPVNTGLLVDVVLKNGEGHSYSGPGTLELISGEGYGGSVLATENIQITAPLGEKTYSFSNAPNITAGTTYTIRVNVPGGSTSNMAFSAQVGAGYPNGVLYQASIFSSADLYFKLFVSSGPGEPLGSTLPSTDETYTISNPPVASNVAITGTLSVGQELTGTYDFIDPQTDTESGSTFKWYSADNAAGSNKTGISGASSKTYTITPNDIGKFLSFEVTPSDGTDTGVAVESQAKEVATPVTIQSVARHTPSASGISSSTNPTFRVTFSEGVRNVNTDDFVLNSAVGGTINLVTPVDASTYDVAVNNLNNADGTLGLKVKGIDGATGTNNITGIAFNNGAAAHTQTTQNDYLNQDLIGQSFTAVSNDYFTAFTMFPRAGIHAFSGTARLRVFQGDASNSTVLNDANAVLSEEVINISTNTAASGQTFTISSPSQLTSGIVYSIVLDSFTGSGARAFNAHTSGSLSNGRAFFTNSNNTSHAAFDFMIDIFEGTQSDGDALFDQAPATNETYTVTGNAAPTASNVSLSGTLKVGQQLSGTYTWADTDVGDTENGSTFQWYRADDASGTNKTAITGATAQTYTLVANDTHKFISFAVVPGDGTDLGIETESSLSQVLNSEPTFTSTAVTTVNDNATYTYDITTSDADGDDVTLTATTIPGWLSLNQNEKGVSTFSGTGLNKSGGNGPGTGVAQDGSLDAASFSWPTDIVIDDQENIYVLDRFEGKLRKIASDGNVTTIAGSEFGTQLGTGTNAKLKYPEAMALGNNNIMYVPSGFSRDAEDFIRKIDVTTGAVTAFAGGLKGISGLAYDRTADILYASQVGLSGEHEILMFDTQGNKTVLAGNGTGFVNGTGTDAKFNYPGDLLLDGNGNLYVSDQGNNSIRRVDLVTKVVSTVAGGSRGSNDGTGTDAQFSGPYGLAMDAQNNLYVADRFNYTIRKIDPNGVVTTVSGIKGESADLDGSLETAKFYDPDGLAIDSQGNLLVTDQYTSKIRKISFTTAHTLTGDATGQTAGDYNVILSANDGNNGTATQTFNVTVVDVTSPVLTSATTAGDFAENGTGTVYTAVATDTNALTYSLGSGNDENVFNIDENTGLVTFKDIPDFENPFDQGSDNGYVINVIATDEANNAANQNVTFSVTNVSDVNPVFTSTAVTTVNDNATYTYDITTRDADGDDVTLTATTSPGWLSLNQNEKGVSTLSGTGLNKSGGNGPGTGVAQDGSLDAASFSWPTDIVIDDQENIYVLDRFEGKLRKIASDGQVTTIAGSEFGTQLGTGTNAKLKYPEAMALGNNNIMYVPSGFSRDAEDFIRKIDVTTGAVTAFADGLKGISGLAYDRTADILYASQVGLSGEHEILMFDTQGNKTVLAGNGTGFVNGTGTDAKFNYPGDLLLDGNGNLYVSDQGNNSIRRVDLVTKVVSTVAGGSRGSNDGTGTDAQFSGPYGLAMDAQNNLYVADRFNYTIRKIDPNGVVTTVSGIKGESADLDGSLETAKFYDPDGLAIDSQGNLLVTDQYTSKIRKISFTTALTLTGDATGQTAGDYDVTLTANDDNGGTATQIFKVTVVDVTAPDKPIITQISDDTGGSSVDGVTSDRNLLIHGTGEALATVEVFSPGGLVGTTRVNANGDWTLDITQYNLQEMTSNTTAETIDLAGNRSATSDGFVITIDFTAPAKPVITGVSDDTGSSNTDGVTSDRNLLVHGTAEAHTSVEIFAPGGSIGIVEADANGNWTLDISRFNLPEMTANMTAEAIDLAGNRSASSDIFVLTIDFTAPAMPVITGISDDTGSSNTDGVTSDRNLLVHGTAEANANVEIFSPGGSIGIVEADANGNWTLDISRFNLPEMTANMTAEAIDLAGNRSASSDGFVITIDFTAPAKPVITGISDDTGSSNTDGVTSDRNLLVHGTAEAHINVEIFSPGGSIGIVEADANGNWTLDISRFNLPEMTANMTAEAIDLAGNRSASSDIFVLTIDFTAPDRPVITGISDDTGSNNTDGVTSDRNLLVHGTAEAHTNVEVFSPGGSIGIVEANANGNWTLDISRFNLPEMTANMTAEAIDLAGNRSATSEIFTVKIDFTAPGVSIDIENSSVAGYLITATFDEEVSNLTLGEITVTGGTASNLVQTNPTTYSFLVNTSTGVVDVTVNAGAAQDLAGNDNTISNQLTLGLPSGSSQEDFTSLRNVRQTEEISVYPNPASKVLTFDLSQLSAEEVDIYMYDAAGVPVFKREAYKEKTLRMNVSDYMSGMYIVQFYDGNRVVRKKVMVRK